MSVQLTAPRYTSPGAAVRFMQEVESRVEQQLGVPATISSSTPLWFGIFFDAHPEAEGLTPPPGAAVFGTARIAPDYFEVFEIPLIAGRTLEPSDGADAIVINETMARRYFGTVSPIGRRFKLDRNMQWATVVGVAGDVKASGPADPMDGGMEFYRPLDLAGRSNYLTLTVPVEGDLQTRRYRGSSRFCGRSIRECRFFPQPRFPNRSANRSPVSVLCCR